MILTVIEKQRPPHFYMRVDVVHRVANFNQDVAETACGLELGYDRLRVEEDPSSRIDGICLECFPDRDERNRCLECGGQRT